MHLLLVLLLVVGTSAFGHDDGSGAGTVTPWYGLVGDTLTIKTAKGANHLIRTDHDGSEASYMGVCCIKRKCDEQKRPDFCGKWRFDGGKEMKLSAKVTFKEQEVQISNLGTEDFKAKYGMLGQEKTEVNFPAN